MAPLPGDSEPGDGEKPAGGPDGAAERAAERMILQSRLLIELAGPACVAAKLQLACFERLGAQGWRALADVVGLARGAGLLVVADGKRGDVPATAAAYAQALLGETPTPWGPVAGLGADAVTVSPLLGGDALDPLVEAAAAAGSGLFCLVRTSNPGAGEVQDLPTAKGPLHERLARIVSDRAARLAGAGGLSGMGAVVGATAPEHFTRLRELMPESIFLIPGIGPQGGRPEDLGPALGAHPASILVPASRAIAAHGDPAAAAERLRASLWSLHH
jgi:orotidine-5'-phosphate decarboxylase